MNNRSIDEDIRKEIYHALDYDNKVREKLESYEKNNIADYIVDSVQQIIGKRLLEGIEKIDKKSFTLGRVRWVIELDDIYKVFKDVLNIEGEM